MAFIEERMTVLENDVAALRSTADARHTAVVRMLQASLDAHSETRQALIAMDAKFDAKFESMDAKFDARFGAMDAKFEGKFESVDAKLESMDAKLDVLMTKLVD